MNKNKLYVSPSPHLHQGTTTQKIMARVIIALLPAIVASTIIFGLKSLLILLVTVVTCVLTEYICRKVMKRSNTISDLSAIVTGILLALSLPVAIHPLMAAFGGVVAILVVKQMFGGIGQNFVNPALTARIVLSVSFPAVMTTWNKPFYYNIDAAADAVANATSSATSGATSGATSAATSSATSAVDALTGATPLAGGYKGSYLDLFLGNIGGCLGETCALALLIGFIYLVVTKVITPIIPLTYIGSVGLFTFILGEDPLFHILTGGLLIGAIFMATDYATTPITNKGKFIFGLGCGIITVLIRVFANLPEGVSFAIVLMNILVPHIDSLTVPKPFGYKKAKGGIKNES